MNRLASFALVLALAGCADSPETRFARAERAFAANDYRAAQIDLTAALQAKPADPRLLELSARTHLAQGDGAAAKAALEQLSAKPADFALLMGEAALLRGRPEEAFSLVAAERAAEAWRIRALAHVARGDDSAAQAAFAAGEAASGPKARLLADHARYRLGRGDVTRAAELSTKALLAGPRALDPLLAGADVAVAKGDLARALTLYDKAVAAYPGNFAALSGKAGVLGDLGRDEELEALIAQVSATAGDNPATAYLEARVAANRRDWQRVRDILQPLEARLDRRDDAQVLYAQALLELGQEEQARARLEPLVRRAPGSGPAVLTLARAQIAGGDGEAATRTLRARAARPEAPHEVLSLMAEATRMARDPSAPAFAARASFPTPQALAAELARGDRALKTGNWQAAATAYRRILAQTDGRNVLVLNNLAYAEQKLGNTRVALNHALTALKLAPGNPSVMDTAGWLLVQTGGDRNRALDLLRRAARLAPENKAIAGHLAEVEKG